MFNFYKSTVQKCPQLFPIASQSNLPTLGLPGLPPVLLSVVSLGAGIPSGLLAYGVNKPHVNLCRPMKLTAPDLLSVAYLSAYARHGRN